MLLSEEDAVVLLTSKHPAVQEARVCNKTIKMQKIKDLEAEIQAEISP